MLQNICYMPKECSLDALLLSSCTINTVTEKKSCFDIVKTLLFNLNDAGLQSRIVNSMKSIRYAPSKVTDVYMFTGNTFDKFRSLAVRSDSIADNSAKEKWIMDSVLFSTDPLFTRDSIPYYKNGALAVPDKYNPNTVYCIREIHDEIYGERRRVEDVLIYIPKKYFNSFNSDVVSAVKRVH